MKLLIVINIVCILIMVVVLILLARYKEVIELVRRKEARRNEIVPARDPIYEKNKELLELKRKLKILNEKILKLENTKKNKDI